MKSHKTIAVSLLRFALGINIFLHGAVRFFNYSGFVQSTTEKFATSPVLKFAVDSFVHAIPFIETGVGFLILLGLFTLPALLIGALQMIALMVGMCFLQGWDIVGLQLNYILVFAVCIYLHDQDRFTVDRVREGYVAKS